MRRRVVTVAAVVLGVVALGWLPRLKESPEGLRSVAVESPRDTSPRSDIRSGPPARAEAEIPAAPISGMPVVETPVDVDTRARFNEQARAFFANAAQMRAEDRLREARQLEQELMRLEQAGGSSAGETLLIRAGLIRETVPASAQQDAQLKALQERYRAETQRRVASAQARPDPQFGSYKARESEIVNEVMAMEAITDGLSRNEYLRRRLQTARETFTPQ
jgi:hypothetical protein